MYFLVKCRRNLFLMRFWSVRFCRDSLLIKTMWKAIFQNKLTIYKTNLPSFVQKIIKSRCYVDLSRRLRLKSHPKMAAWERLILTSDHFNRAIHSKEAQSYRDGLTKILKPQPCKLSFLEYYMKEFKCVLDVLINQFRDKMKSWCYGSYVMQVSLQQPMSEDQRRLAELFAIEVDQDVLSAEIEVFQLAEQAFWLGAK